MNIAKITAKLKDLDDVFTQSDPKNHGIINDISCCDWLNIAISPIITASNIDVNSPIKFPENIKNAFNCINEAAATYKARAAVMLKYLITIDTDPIPEVFSVAAELADSCWSICSNLEEIRIFVKRQQRLEMYGPYDEQEEEDECKYRSAYKMISYIQHAITEDFIPFLKLEDNGYLLNKIRPYLIKKDKHQNAE